MSNSFVKADLKKLDNLIKELDKKAYVDIGILETAIHPESNETIAYIGSVHEFGTDKAGRGNNTKIPERSFIRTPLETKGKEIEKKAEINLEKNLAEGKIDKILSQIGAAGEAVIQEAFETGGFGKWPKLSESTIESKGSSSILIDEGYLRKSITYETNKGGK